MNMKMDKVTKIYLRYCEMGLISEKYNKIGIELEREANMDCNCNTVLCIPCWNKKVTLHEKDMKERLGTQSKHCSARKRT